MKPLSRIFRVLISVATVSAAFASTPALAAPFFTVDESSVPGSIANLVLADRINFDYTSRIEQTIGGGSLAGGDDPFTQEGFLTKGAFSSPGGSVPSQLNALEIIGGYKVYGIFSITGESDLVGTNIRATFNTVNLHLFIDPNSNTTFAVSPIAGSGPIVPGGITIDDYEIASYTMNAGLANIDGTGGLANGDFDTLLNVTLTPAGQAFFVSPNPFFNLENFGGNIETLTPAGNLTTSFTSISNGGGIELFVAAVPEPGSIALFGIGLLGLGIFQSRNNKYHA